MEKGKPCKWKVICKKKTNIESAAGSRREKEEGEEEKEEEEEEKEEMRRAEACFSFLGQHRCKEPILPLNICVDTFEVLPRAIAAPPL